MATKNIKLVVIGDGAVRAQHFLLLIEPRTRCDGLHLPRSAKPACSSGARRDSRCVRVSLPFLSYANNRFPEDYIPTVFGSYSTSFAWYAGPSNCGIIQTTML